MDTLDSLKDFFNCLEEGIIFLDEQRQAVFVNLAATRMLGHSSSEIVGSLCPSLFQETPCSRACSKRGHCSLTTSLEDSSDSASKTQDLTMKSPDGTTFFLRMWATLLPPPPPYIEVTIDIERTLCAVAAPRAEVEEVDEDAELAEGEVAEDGEAEAGADEATDDEE